MIEIVGITVCAYARSCEEHPYCREIIDEDVIVCLCHMQVIMHSKNGGPGQEVTVVTVYWVTDGNDHCCMGFYPVKW